jgi:formylmethanofuran dehydrogenase subunit E
MNNNLKKIEMFHGHLGPYVVIGYKMGLIANKHLGNDSFSKKAIVWTGTKPPISCIIDGIQISSGCTLGKGNIEIKNDKNTKVEFTHKNGNRVIISLKPEIKNEIDIGISEENLIDLSMKINDKKDSELFEIVI